MGTIIAKHFDYCYNTSNRQFCIVDQQNVDSGQNSRRLFVFQDSAGTDGKSFADKLNKYIADLQQKGKKLEIGTEQCNPDTNFCQVDVDFSKLF